MNRSKGAIASLLTFAMAAVAWAITPATTLVNFAAARKFAASLWASYSVRVAPFAAAFQSTVIADMAWGIPGEPAFDGPTRVQPGITKGTAANIVFGRWFSIDPADGKFQPGGDAGVPGGVLILPKTHALYGTAAGGALAPALTLPVNTPAEFMTMGQVWVSLANAAAIGAPVYYDDVTGILGAGTAGAGQTQIPGAAVIRYATGAPGLAVVSLTGN